MPDVLIVGDGPAGLSAALFLAKKGMSVIVFAQDQTLMHKALLLNYLGIPKLAGTQFQEIARKQVTDMGTTIQDVEVTALEKTDGGFVAHAGDQRYEAKYLILAMGPQRDLAKSIGLDFDASGALKGDRNGKTNVPNLYVTGWASRPDKIQAIISAGDGAAAALDILSAEAGKDIHDFDVV